MNRVLSPKVALRPPVGEIRPPLALVGKPARLSQTVALAAALVFAPPAFAWVPGDLDASGSVNVVDVQITIALTFADLSGAPLSGSIDKNNDGWPDGLAQVGTCAAGTVKTPQGLCQLDSACSTPVACDDGNPCTEDSCAAGAGCVHLATTLPCDDANPCTVGDKCAAGACVSGAAAPCNDGDPCTTDQCTVALGCTHAHDPSVCPGGTTVGTIGPDGWPIGNIYSWDGSYSPKASDFPLAGLFDDEYYDGHTNWNGVVSPILPPGDWDWNNANDDLANWKNFSNSIGGFAKLLDGAGNHFGWQVVGKTPNSVPYSGAAAYYSATPGVDLLDLGPLGIINSFTNGNLGDGPDILVFDKSWSLDFRTGSDLGPALHDNDLVIGGCQTAPVGDYTFQKTTIHTGPGRDWIFGRNINGAAIDAGNGDGGKTEVLDPTDGNDLVMLSGNIRDARVFGGWGSDTVVWYMDDADVETIAFAGPNFFGGGGSGAALWADPGVDRLVFVIPPNTAIVKKTPTPKASLLFRVLAGDGDEIWWDDPVYNDPYARYCITCGTGPQGQKTMNLEYLSADGSFFTGWFWVTAFEELQLGVGPGAVVYAIDQVAGTLTPIPNAVPFNPPAWPWHWCE